MRVRDNTGERTLHARTAHRSRAGRKSSVNPLAAAIIFVRMTRDVCRYV